MSWLRPGDKFYIKMLIPRKNTNSAWDLILDKKETLGSVFKTCRNNLAKAQIFSKIYNLKGGKNYYGSCKQSYK